MTVLTGPIHGGSGTPFGSPPDDLLARGYVMEEFLLEGTANSYRPVPGTTPGIDGRWEVEPAEVASFATRMYVVRPADATDFNGIVLVNWQNVTAGYDLGMPPREAYEGFAWVGVTTQRVGIEGQPALGVGLDGTVGLPEIDPERYATLHHPGDAFSYDIFTQAARLVAPDRVVGRVDPLGGLQPRRILATGGSQSAMRLGSYLNLVQRTEQVFDGFLLSVHWGMCPLPPDQRLMKSFKPTSGGLTAGSSRIRDDIEEPVLALCSETETMHNYVVRQPDTETFRFWEMAGTAHAGAEETAREIFEGLDLRDKRGERVTVNTIQWNYMVDVGLRHLVAWVERGVAPPRFPPIDVDAEPKPSIHRDAWGNATGGIRLPEIVAATATYRGDNAGNPVAALFGETMPFSAEVLRARYADRAAYRATWKAAVDALVASGLDIGREVEALSARGLQIASELELA